MAVAVFIQDEFICTRSETVSSTVVTRGAHMSHQETKNALVISDVTKTFGKDGGKARRWPWQKPAEQNDDKVQKQVAVDHISMSVQHKEIFGILGANGSGKSTLIRLVSTLLVPDSGQVTVFGHDVIREEMAVKRLINRVSVDAAFFKKLSPMENLMYAARLYGMDAREAEKKIVEILTKLGIEKKSIYTPIEDMSRGMQQKVSIARAFLTAPILLLLDEPTTGLDPRSKHDVQDFVLNLRDVHDTTIVLTTHDMEEADRLCDRIAILNQGKIVAMDTPTGLKATIRSNGRQATMEDVFMKFTGKTAEDLKNEEGV